MPPIKILSIQQFSETDAEMIRSVDPRIVLTDAGGWFDGEIRETWPPFTAARYLQPGAEGHGDRTERNNLLAEAEIIIGGWPFPLDLRSRSPRLKWFHQRPAGASNLLSSDLWRSDVTVTTSRGQGNTLAIAEYVIAGVLHFAKNLPQATVEREKAQLNYRDYSPLLLSGKKVCVVGVGGIGREVGRLCAALGMRVVGTRRQPDGADVIPEGFSKIGDPDALDQFLGESDVVAICCQWTPETTHLFNAARLGLMKPECILVNVARGEIIDEQALVDALRAKRLRGAVLDVYDGEFERPPLDALWSDPRVLITPHISGASDQNRHRAIELFCQNLRAYIDGDPLENVIDWNQGY